MNIGCSSFSWSTKNGSHLLGRTCDMYALKNYSIAFLPRNQQLKLTSSDELTNTKYSLLGFGLDITDTPILIDGVNEHGLAGCLLYYPGFADYSDYIPDIRNINAIYYLSYALGMYQNIAELCEDVDNINLIDEEVAGGPAPVHFILSDRTGETVIIEPDQNGLNVHRNTIGVLTNSPNYEWHKQNLRNYIGMQCKPRADQELEQFTVKPFGEGTGLLGLPGDYTPPSRFVRIAYLKNLVDRMTDERLAVSMMVNIFASVTIPMGLHRNHDDVNEGTLYTSVMCNNSLIYYLSNCQNHRLVALDLNKLKDTNEPRRFSLDETEDIRWLI